MQLKVESCVRAVLSTTSKMRPLSFSATKYISSRYTERPRIPRKYRTRYAVRPKPTAEQHCCRPPLCRVRRSGATSKVSQLWLEHIVQRQGQPDRPSIARQHCLPHAALGTLRALDVGRWLLSKWGTQSILSMTLVGLCCFLALLRACAPCHLRNHQTLMVWHCGIPHPMHETLTRLAHGAHPSSHAPNTH